MKETLADEITMNSFFLICDNSGLILGEFCGNCGVIIQQANVKIKIKIIGMH